MILDEIQLFRNLSPEFMRDMSDVFTRQTFEPEQVVFKKGARAERFYILVEGQVHLVISDRGSVNFLLDRPGQIFGWSAMVEPNIYTASAQCYEHTNVLAVNALRIERIFERHPMDGYHVMKRLAGVVSERLMQTYENMARTPLDTDPPSYG